MYGGWFIASAPCEPGNLILACPHLWSEGVDDVVSLTSGVHGLRGSMMLYLSPLECMD